jgi:hypothetical protein
MCWLNSTVYRFDGLVNFWEFRNRVSDDMAGPDDNLLTQDQVKLGPDNAPDLVHKILRNNTLSDHHVGDCEMDGTAEDLYHDIEVPQEAFSLRNDTQVQFSDAEIPIVWDNDAEDIILQSEADDIGFKHAEGPVFSQRPEVKDSTTAVEYSPTPPTLSAFETALYLWGQQNGISRVNH